MVTQGTGLSIGLVVIIIGGLITSHIWIDGRFDALSEEVQEVRNDVRDLKGKTADRWKAAEMKIWAEELKAANPEIDVPDPWEIIDRREDGI